MGKIQTGLFDFSEIDFSDVFKQCTSLSTIPVGLFSGTTTDFPIYIHSSKLHFNL